MIGSSGFLLWSLLATQLHCLRGLVCEGIEDYSLRGKQLEHSLAIAGTQEALVRLNEDVPWLPPLKATAVSPPWAGWDRKALCLVDLPAWV